MNNLTWHQKCMYRVSIKAVIRDDNGKVLVVKEKNRNDWNLPGGGMDYGESEVDALRRELYEEVGFSGEFSAKPLGIHSHWLEKKQAWQMWVIYQVKPASFEFSVGDEADEIAFIDFRNDSEMRKDLNPNLLEDDLLSKL